MSSPAEVAAAVRAVVEALPVAKLAAAADGLEHATILLAQAGEGSSNAQVAEAIARMSRAHSMTLDLLRVCESARVRLLAAVARIASSGTGEVGAQGGGAAAGGSSPRRPSRAERIERARRAIRPGVTGAQAEGRWLGPGEDSTMIRSGTGDEWYDRVSDFVAASAPRFKQARRLATHMEVRWRCGCVSRAAPAKRWWSTGRYAAGWTTVTSRSLVTGCWRGSSPAGPS